MAGNNNNWGSNENIQETYEEYDAKHRGGQTLFDLIPKALYYPNSIKRTGYINDIKRLIQAGADVDTPNFFGGETSLHVASEAGNKKIVELLLDAGARVNPDDIEVAPKAIKDILILAPTISRKARNQKVRNILEARAGIASEPGTGAANTIRDFLGAATPRGAEGAFGSNNAPWVLEVGPVPRGKSRKWKRAKGGKRTYRLKRRL
jgi:ankyrin repeat protein